MAKKPSQYSKAAQLGIIVGCLLILFGISKILEKILGSYWWGAIGQFFNTAFSFIWPVALIVAGIYLVWAASSGKFKGVSIDTSRPFRRSASDKRISGVCGGIAHYIGIDPTVVRVIAVIMLAVWPVATSVIYLVAAILVPKA